MADSPPPDWPLVDASKMIRGPVHHWHVQQQGHGPDLLLLHGAGGSTHSFRDIIPRLAKTHRVTALDLPGHGFTTLGAQRRSGLKHMAEDVAALCDRQDVTPKAIIGHSAGAAVALQIARFKSVDAIVGINPALSNFGGLAGVVFPAMAKLLASVPFTAKLFSGSSANPKRIKSLIDSTGSHLGPEGLRYYQMLVQREAHVSGALSMMAQWSLDDLLRALASIETPTLFITGQNDKTVSPTVAKQAAAQLPNATVIPIDGYGHLVHEEIPDRIAAHCLDAISEP